MMMENQDKEVLHSLAGKLDSSQLDNCVWGSGLQSDPGRFENVELFFIVIGVHASLLSVPPLLPSYAFEISAPWYYSGIEVAM